MSAYAVADLSSVSTSMPDSSESLVQILLLLELFMLEVALLRRHLWLA